MVGRLPRIRTQSGLVAAKKTRWGGRHLGEAAVPEAECGPCPVSAWYAGIRLTTKEKSRENLSQDSRKVPAGHDSFCRSGGSHCRDRL